MEFETHDLTNSSIYTLYLDQEQIFISPSYQRMGDVWPLYKKQLLIDSILNGFDIPKLYFHQFVPPRVINGKRYKYAIIDGRQRLQAIWDFIDNEFPLGDQVTLVNDASIDLSDLTYDELASQHPRIKAKFDSKRLDVVCIVTDDVELIEDMFSRLNEALPLNAAEKRNALGGPLPKLIRALCKKTFFTAKLPFSNTRYRHYDLACKFMYLEQEGNPADTKKIKLDEFVKLYKVNPPTPARALYSASVRVLEKMSRVFVQKDDLLQSIGTVTLLYLLFRDKTVKNLGRKQLQEFENARAKNREIAERDIAQADYDLLEFDRLTQSPNDAASMAFRLKVIRKFLHKLG